MKKIELLNDPSFETGFHLLGINPVVDQRKFFRHLNYNNTAKKSDRVIWQLAQWWTPHNVIDAKLKKVNDEYLYETESRVFGIDINKQQLRMNLYGSKEYLNGPRSEISDPWSHLLIEQDFKESVNLLDLEKLE